MSIEKKTCFGSSFEKIQMFFWENFLFRSDISFLGRRGREGGMTWCSKKFYRPRAIFNIPGPPCVTHITVKTCAEQHRRLQTTVAERALTSSLHSFFVRTRILNQQFGAGQWAFKSSLDPYYWFIPSFVRLVMRLCGLSPFAPNPDLAESQTLNENLLHG